MRIHYVNSDSVGFMTRCSMTIRTDEKLGLVVDLSSSSPEGAGQIGMSVEEARELRDAIARLLPRSTLRSVPAKK